GGGAGRGRAGGRRAWRCLRPVPPLAAGRHAADPRPPRGVDRAHGDACHGAVTFQQGGIGMVAPRTERRDFLEQAAALGAVAIMGWRPTLARAGGARERSGAKMSYDPAGKFELKVSDVEFLRTPKGRQLMARVYQPQGPGPFPTVLDLHGGAWRRKDRLAEEPMDRAIASSGVLVVAGDLRLSEEPPYPASVQDGNYGVRWLKSRAVECNGDATKLGVYGSA